MNPLHAAGWLSRRGLAVAAVALAAVTNTVGCTPDSSGETPPGHERYPVPEPAGLLQPIPGADIAAWSTALESFGFVWVDPGVPANQEIGRYEPAEASRADVERVHRMRAPDYEVLPALGLAGARAVTDQDASLLSVYCEVEGDRVATGLDWDFLSACATGSGLTGISEDDFTEWAQPHLRGLGQAHADDYDDDRPYTAALLVDQIQIWLTYDSGVTAVSVTAGYDFGGGQ